MQQFNCSIWSFTNLQWSFPLSPLPSYSAFIQSYQCNGYLEWQLIARLHKICQQWGWNSIWVCSVVTQLVNKIPTLQTCLNTLPWDNLELFPQQFFWHQCHNTQVEFCFFICLFVCLVVGLFSFVIFLGCFLVKVEYFPWNVCNLVVALSVKHFYELKSPSK